MTERLFVERVLSKRVFSESVSLAAVRGGRVVAFCQAGPRPAADGEGPDRSVGVVSLLLVDPGEDGAADRLLAGALEELRSAGARSAEAMTAGGGYPYFRGLFCGTEPALPDAAAGEAEALARAGFAARQRLVLLACPLAFGRPGRGAPEGFALEARELPLASLWQRESWRGMSPRIAHATRGRERAGRVVWAMLPGVSSPAGGAVGSIAELSVRADLRGRGIGGALIGRALEELASAGASEAIVTAEADSEAALAAYRSAGFAEAAPMSAFRRLVL
jgi:ribosomal protein S18 acetylase RimI-like enzyme